MANSARGLLDEVQAELAPRDDENALVPLIVSGEAPRHVFAAIAGEEHRIVRADWRSALTLAGRANEPRTREFFAYLAAGEGAALGRLSPLATATGLTEEGLRAYRPLAGCQAYPAYFAWLALNGEPAEVVVALVTNFAAWGRYCAAIATAMREKYDFDDAACGFFDLFASPDPRLETLAVDAVQDGLDRGLITDEAWTSARLFQSYELMFWNTLAEVG